MNQRTTYLPLLFIVSFAAVLIYTYHYYSSIQLSQPEVHDHRAIHSGNPINPAQGFTFTIEVLTFNRIDSLRRCLLSLVAGDYGNDRVNLHVHVDHFTDIVSSNGSVSLLEEKLNESRRILDLVDGFDWIHGEKLVHYRTRNVGLQAQWIEAWWPVSDNDFAFVVEDDLELSPLYYKYLKTLILKYYYDRFNYSPLIYGASLQRPRFVSGKNGNKLEVDSETRLFLYQMVGTWGQLLFPKPWKEFRLWYNEHKAKNFKPMLQGMVTTGWYKKMGERIWTPWFIKFIHARGYYNFYTNFRHERALSISHRDAGVNYGRTAGPDSILLDERSLDFNILDTKSLKYLKWYDFCFSEVHHWRFVRSYDELGPVLANMDKQKPVVIVNLYRTTVKMAKNLLCHLKQLNLQNIVFIGRNLELIEDFSRRGYAVVDSAKLLGSLKSHGIVKSEQVGSFMAEEVLVLSNVVKKSLELGYDSWVIDGSVIPLGDFFAGHFDPSCTFFAAKNVDILYVRKSQTSLKIWIDEFISKTVSLATSLTASQITSPGYKHFTYFAKKVLDDDDRMNKVCVFDDMVNITSQNGSKMMFWSKNTDLDATQRELESLKMWLVDEDLSCVSVVCHREQH